MKCFQVFPRARRCFFSVAQKETGCPSHAPVWTLQAVWRKGWSYCATGIRWRQCCHASVCCGISCRSQHRMGSCSAGKFSCSSYGRCCSVCVSGAPVKTSFMNRSLESRKHSTSTGSSIQFSTVSVKTIRTSKKKQNTVKILPTSSFRRWKLRIS